MCKPFRMRDTTGASVSKWRGADDDTLSVHRTVGKGKNSVLLNGTEGLDTILAKARTEYLLGVLDNWTEMVPFR